VLEYQLLSPEEESGELYPYRRVWRSLILEMVILLFVVAAVFIGVQLDIMEDTYSRTGNILLALLPIGLFYVFSVRSEQRVAEPRRGLLIVLLLSVIVANGVAWTVIQEVFTPDRWLVEAGFFSRIIGYTFTLGLLAEFCKYAVIRYTVWPDRFRYRLDGVAYSVPAALGYALVVNLHFLLQDEPTISAAAIRVLVNVYLHITVGALMGYFLAELLIGRVPFFWLPFGLFLASFISSLFIAFRRIAVVSGLGSRDIGGLLLVLGFTVFVLGAVAFLIDSADERTAARVGLRRLR
jgi:RsiW-degrading membrane proteinase PrsW (M82 family)